MGVGLGPGSTGKCASSRASGVIVAVGACVGVGVGRAGECLHGDSPTKECNIGRIYGAGPAWAEDTGHAALVGL